MRRLLALTALCLCAACDDTLSPSESLIILGSVSHTAVAPPDSVWVTLTIVNQGRESVQLDLNECVPPYVVLDDEDDVVGPGSRICPLDSTAPTILAGGGTLGYTTTWSGDSSGAGPDGKPIYLSAGQYRVRPRVTVIGEEPRIVYGLDLPVTVTINDALTPGRPGGR